MKYFIVSIAALLIAFTESDACTSGNAFSNPCEFEVSQVVVGDESDGVFDAGSVNIRFAHNGTGYWFWTNSPNKNMVLAMAMTALSTGKRLTVRYKTQNNGSGHIPWKILNIQMVQ